MAVHGSLGQFNDAAEDRTSYCERLVEYFTANDIKSEEKRRVVLLSICGASTYQLIRSLVTPHRPGDKLKGFDEIVKLVRDHLTPASSCIVRRFHFNSRFQKEGEAVSKFVAELRRLSEFGGSVRRDVTG